MAAQSPLSRFFTPASAKKVELPSPPQTPTPRVAAEALSGAPAEDKSITPPSATARKRAASAKENGRAKKAAKEPAAGTATPAAQAAPAPTAPAKESARAKKAAKEPAAGTAAPAAEEAPAPSVTSDPPPPQVPPAPVASDAPRDLRATLQQAQRSAPGSLPPFTAECFHHYENGGSQYSWPFWLKPENLKDAQGLRPTEPGYNGSTLWVPDQTKDAAAYKNSPGHNTPMLMQFWKLKAVHFDKVALFKVGKFYEIFYYDAFIAQRICNLKWMGAEKKPHVGFPEMAKHEYARQIVEAGFKVVVVEQVERVVETNQRKSEGKNDGNKATGPTCVERDACEVFTSGTLVDPELLGGAGARFMVYLHFEDSASAGLNFAACLVDCATSQIQLGRFVDGPDRNELRTLLAQVQPSEVVYDWSNLPVEVLQLLKRLPCRPQLSAIYGRGNGGLLAARDRLNRYRKDHPDALKAVEAVLAAQDSTSLCAAGVMDYLEAVLLGQRVLPFATWELLDAATGVSAGGGSSPQLQRMVLDATALSALEVVETLEGGHDGSLLSFLDHTSTPFGYRLLKQWICAPLCNLQEIQERQDAVEFFMQRPELSQQLSSGLKKCIAGSKQPVDLERATSRIWSYALQAERKAVMYEDITARRLGHFMELLEAFEQCFRLLASGFPKGSELPGRLAKVAKGMADGGSLPDLLPVIERLKHSVVEAPAKNGGTKHRPQDGCDAAYDEKTKQVNMVLSQLDQELKSVQAKYPKVHFTYVHRLPGFRYEIECEEQVLPPQLQRSVDITSRMKSKVRFHTSKIKELIAQLDQLENEREDCIFPFLSKLFSEFHKHQGPFRATLRCVSELDALLSLAGASRSMAGASCKPEFKSLGAEEPACLELVGCRHPVAASKMGNSFVPNDTKLNAANVPGVLVVTGPNMGGKSTVLRQTCLAVIMAQLGCRVNAERCRLSAVDRIFTRIGAYDAVLEGKSTLLTELEETAAVLSHGTRRSLAVLDELGRGTSTFDGAAIASAVLDELKDRVGCMVMFATHYHPVSREAAKDTAKVAPFHMSAAVDPTTNEMTFLYKFLPGLCPASHGHNVAKIAGLPEKVLQEALERSAEFESGAKAASQAFEEAAELAKLGAQRNEVGLREVFRRRQALGQVPS